MDKRMAARFAVALGVAAGLAVALSTGNPMHLFWSLADDAVIGLLFLYKVVR